MAWKVMAGSVFIVWERVVVQTRSIRNGLAEMVSRWSPTRSRVRPMQTRHLRGPDAEEPDLGSAAWSRAVAPRT